jgi:endonuclease/exonuclease/phosphatase family metal-dependent hydrolase
MHKVITTTLLLFAALTTLAQSAPIAIDGLFDDWTNNLKTVTDPSESISGIDLLEMSVTNDDEWLYINITTDNEFDISDDLIDHNIRLYLDTDNDASTGTAIQAEYGAELAVFFRNRTVQFNGSNNLKFSDFSMRALPTVTSNRFEIAIKRDARPDGSTALFNSETVKILWLNTNNNDRLPNQGEVFSYTFDRASVAAKTPVDINKEDSTHVRIVAYNTLFDGLTNAGRVPHFASIITSLNPDIIGFSECNNVTAAQVKVLLDDWLPTGTTNGWYVDKHSSHGLITASRWAFKERWQTLERQFPVLIDLPEYYTKDLLFTNAHLKCCTGETQRQNQADQYINFIQDAKTTGGVIDLPQGTPFVYGGDLNLVGYAQQLTTLITGDIQNTATYGNGGSPDWDDTEVTDLVSLQTDNRFAFTWNSETSRYPAGKLDFMLYSDAVTTAEKSFVLRTEIIPAGRLQQYGLAQDDTESASDHYPVVADFSMPTTLSVPNINSESSIKIYPNPSNNTLRIDFHKAGKHKVTLTDANGTVLLTHTSSASTTSLDVSAIASGIYFVTVTSGDGNSEAQKWVKI